VQAAPLTLERNGAIAISGTPNDDYNSRSRCLLPEQSRCVDRRVHSRSMLGARRFQTVLMGSATTSSSGAQARTNGSYSDPVRTFVAGDTYLCTAARLSRRANVASALATIVPNPTVIPIRICDGPDWRFNYCWHTDRQSRERDWRTVCRPRCELHDPARAEAIHSTAGCRKRRLSRRSLDETELQWITRMTTDAAANSACASVSRAVLQYDF